MPVNERANNITYVKIYRSAYTRYVHSVRYLKTISSLGKSALIYIFISLLFPVNFRGVSKGGMGQWGVS